MSRDLGAALEQWLQGGQRQMGEILIRAKADGYELRHAADLTQADLRVSSHAGEARRIALFSDTGEYRPLKTAPNLRRGWVLELSTLREVRQALDFFYPAMLGVLLEFEIGRLRPVPLRQTLARQSGMYAVTRKLTNEQAQALVARVCRSDGGCLKTILWRIDADLEVRSLPPRKFDPAEQQANEKCAPPLPMLCQEACNILVAQAREVVKAEAKSEPQTTGANFA